MWLSNQNSDNIRAAEQYLISEGDYHQLRKLQEENSIFELWADALRRNGWITWCFANAFIHITWIVCLLICQLYQVHL